MISIKHTTLIIFTFISVILKAQNADVYIMSGNAREELGDLAGALEQYSKAIEDDSTSSMAYFNRAFVKRKMNEYEEAILDYTMAIKFKPNYQIAYNNRGIVYMLLGKKEEACMDWVKAAEMGYPNAIKLLEEFCNYKVDTVPK